MGMEVPAYARSMHTVVDRFFFVASWLRDFVASSSCLCASVPSCLLPIACAFLPFIPIFGVSAFLRFYVFYGATM